MKKVLAVFGTRPEAIKMAPVVQELVQQNHKFDVRVCVSAQHREMLDQVLEVFSIVPDFDLDIMRHGQTLEALSARILERLGPVLEEVNPDIVLVHGDTTTCLCASLAAFYRQIPVGHVEAGLRTYDLSKPFPEELNRQLCTKISALHFAPTQGSKENLLSEGVTPSDIWVTGNTVIDALMLTLKQIGDDRDLGSRLRTRLIEHLNFNFETERYVLITGHRRENFGDGFLAICEAISELAARNKTIKFVYPVHLNPNVQEPVSRLLDGLHNVHLIPPLDYQPFVWLLKHCFMVMTDSGGIQEEAPSLGKPVLVMRDVTERPEAVDAGTVVLVGSDKERIIRGVQTLLDDEGLYEEMSKAHNPYGDGTASHKIAHALDDFFKNREKL